jgi:hypothetical protein
MINGNMITETKESFLKFFTSIKELNRIAVVVTTKDKQVVKVIHYPPLPVPPPSPFSSSLSQIHMFANCYMGGKR